MNLESGEVICGGVPWRFGSSACFVQPGMGLYQCVVLRGQRKNLGTPESLSRPVLTGSTGALVFGGHIGIRCGVLMPVRAVRLARLMVGAVLDLVVLVLRVRAPTQVRKNVVRRIAVKVANFFACSRGADEGFGY